VLRELRIPHVIVHDSDRGKPGEKENAYIRRNAGKAPIFQLNPDFEGAAGIRSHDHKVFNAWRRFRSMPEERIPRVFREIADATVKLASGQPA
jgi:hypothetical protein